jgi:hypothetical protein
LSYGLLATDRVHHVSSDHPARVRIAFDLLPDLPSFIRRVCSGSGPDWGGSQTRSV